MDDTHSDKHSEVEIPFERAPPALDSASLVSKAFFGWVSPLLKKGDAIDEDALNDLQNWDQADFLGQMLATEWAKEVASRKKPSLARAILRTFSSQILWGAVWSAIEIGTKIAEAVLLGKMITGFQTNGTNFSSDGYYYAAGLSLVTVTKALLHHASWWIGTRLAGQIKTALTTLMYRKAMNLPAGSTSSGVVINLVSNDVAVFDLLCSHGQYLWMGPIEIPICAYLLYTYLSWPSLLGLIVIVLVIPLQGVFGRFFHAFRRRMVAWRDSRVRLMSDLITGMPTLKFQGWRAPFVEEVSKLRENELRYLKKSATFDSFNEALSFSFPMLVNLIVYGSTAAAGIPMSAPNVFSAAVIFSSLRYTLTAYLPKAVKSANESLVSLARIAEFLLEPESDQQDQGAEGEQEQDLTDVVEGTPVVTIDHASFAWDSFALRDLSLTFRAGELTAVIGPVGAGKSSLVQAVLGEMPTTEGTVTVARGFGRMAYAPQVPWILAGSILDNILFGASFDEDWLRQVISICSLERDLQQWPHGLATIVGERGVSLSGGQRARVALSRAVYARAPVLILDDPLSAVDTRVARRIFDAVRNAPELAHTARILVTHQLQFVRECDAIVVLDQGRVAAQGTWEEVRAVHATRVEDVGAESASSDWMAILGQYDGGAAPAAGGNGDFDEMPSAGSSSTAIAQATGDLVEEEVDLSAGASKRAAAMAASTAAVQAETSQVGAVRWSTFYRFLVVPTPGYLVVIAMFFMLSAQTFAVFSDWTLAKWVSAPVEVQHDDNSYFTAFWILVTAAAVTGMVRAILTYRMLLMSSGKISRTMLEKVLDAPLAWFTANPIGRILNRFTKDQAQVDEMLPFAFYQVLLCFFQGIGVLTVVAIVLPWVTIAIPFVLFMFAYMRGVYVRASRQIKRIESTTRGPVYSHLSESLEGLPVIRALRGQPMFVQRMSSYIDANSRAVFAQGATTRWLAVQLDLSAALFLTVSAFAAQFISSTGGLPPALAGLALSYVLQLNGLLQWLVRQSADVEMVFVAVERMLEYVDLTTESDAPDQALPAIEWPQSGSLVIRNMGLQYPGTPDPVLKHWNVEFKDSEKIGIVGRTGAGKSTLMHAIFRTYNYTGTMFLDGIDTSTLQVEELRKRMSIIPQEPFLFKGTLRFNLDPFGDYTDADVWTALDRVELKLAVEQFDGKLDAPVEDGGANFSVGQRQLLCLGRSLLKKSRVLVCDEATANIDFRSDALIQKVLKTEFEQTLVLTIAHRLSTVADYDRILVVDRGQVAEIGHAHELLQNKDGVLCRMVNDMGDGASSIRDMALASWEARKKQD
ncbi:P-loop containing nucleoside triphosphate hydrolase protein [Blastocladiella britannica]|nr:P-loop containing nucleoside triphosphate hydrolase protein [Blastocladiella britannica]